MVYSIQTWSRQGTRILSQTCAKVLKRGGNCWWAGGLKGWLIRVHQAQSKRISCKGQHRHHRRSPKHTYLVCLQFGLYTILPLPMSYGINCNKSGSAGNTIILAFTRYCVCWIRDCALINTILGTGHLLYCGLTHTGHLLYCPPLYVANDIGRYMVSPQGPVLPFSIQYWYCYSNIV